MTLDLDAENWKDIPSKRGGGRYNSLQRSCATMLTTELIHALPISDRRVFNRSEAASYVGVSTGYFDKLIASGNMPKALSLPGVKRWDKAALDRALDKMSAINPHQTSPSEA